MKNVIRLALVDPSDATRAQMKNMLLGIDMVWLEAECSRYDFFVDVVKQTQPDIALVSLDGDTQKALQLLAQVSQIAPACNILVVSSSQEGSLILQAMRNGAREFLNFPVNLDDFLAAINRIRQSGSGGDSDEHVDSNRVITVAGVGGGVGCTSLAINLACILASNPNHTVAIIDLDFALGDADVWLDIIPDYTIQDVAENISRLDYSLLKRSLTKHDCGAFLLPRPVQIDDSLNITPEALRRVIALLKATFTHLVIDVTKSYSAIDFAALDLSDDVLLTTQLDLPCLRNVVRVMHMMENHDDLPEKVKVVVNRLGLEDSQISLNKALDTIGREIYWQIPNDYACMVESRNNGVPLLMNAPKAKLTRSIQQLAAQITGETNTELAVEKEKQKKSLFGFLGSGGKVAKT